MKKTKNDNTSKQVFRILSCDDESQIKELLWTILNEEGHIVDFAKNGEEVFQRIKKTRYDLVILDVNMPRMNGYKVSENICKTIKNRPKILIFTGRDLEAEKLQFVCSDADAILQKGASLERILETVYSLLIDKTDSASGKLAAPSLNAPVYSEEKDSIIRKSTSEFQVINTREEPADSTDEKEDTLKTKASSSINPVSNEYSFENKRAENKNREPLNATDREKAKNANNIQDKNEEIPIEKDSRETQNKASQLKSRDFQTEASETSSPVPPLPPSLSSRQRRTKALEKDQLSHPSMFLNPKISAKDDKPESQNESMAPANQKSLQYCIDQILKIEKLIANKTKISEELIRHMLTEKQNAEKNSSEFKKLKSELKTMRKWLYIIFAISAFTVLKPFIR